MKSLKTKNAKEFRALFELGSNVLAPGNRKLATVFRDRNGREGLMYKGEVVEMKGEFDCEYRRTYLIDVEMFKWEGKSPKLPLQYLGFVDNADVDRVKEMLR